MSGESHGYELCVKPHYAWMQKLFSLVPGARGYLRREKIREADVLIRRYVAERLSQAESILRRAAGLLASSASNAYFASIPSLTPRPVQPAAFGGATLDPRVLLDAANRLNMLSADILYADAGWAPVSSVQAIRENMLLKLCEIDDTLIGLSEVVAEAARQLEASLAAGDAGKASQLLRDILEALDKISSTLSERKRLLRLETEAQVDSSVVNRARSLLEALASKLGLR